MARPRTFAPPIAFRLPPEHDDKLHQKAQRSGLPLAVYVREVMINILDNGNGFKPTGETLKMADPAVKVPRARKTVTRPAPIARNQRPAAKKTPAKKTAAKKKAPVTT